ncbi:MAG: hypothetical protein IKE58_02845 [Blautia sp.]|nr:hypothetical protein [Blautia sp.]
MFRKQTVPQKLFQLLKAAFPAIFLAAIVICFAISIRLASKDSLSNQQESLERALRGGAVRTYALTGSYPQSLEELTKTYHITYDPEKFIVEYTPTAANLLPDIFVIPRKDNTDRS